MKGVTRSGLVRLLVGPLLLWSSFRHADAPLRHQINVWKQLCCIVTHRWYTDTLSTHDVTSSHPAWKITLTCESQLLKLNAGCNRERFIPVTSSCFGVLNFLAANCLGNKFTIKAASETYSWQLVGLFILFSVIVYQSLEGEQTLILDTK